MTGAGSASAYATHLTQELAMQTPYVASLTDAELERRRDRLHIELATVNEEMQLRGMTRNAMLQRAKDRQATPACAPAPLDPSDSIPFA